MMQSADAERVLSMKNVFCSLFIVSLIACEPKPFTHADYEKTAKAWLASMNIAYDGVGCSAIDSDKDGYMTCQVRFGKKLSPLLCDLNGCKPKDPDNFVAPVASDLPR